MPVPYLTGAIMKSLVPPKLRHPLEEPDEPRNFVAQLYRQLNRHGQVSTELAITFTTKQFWKRSPSGSGRS